MTWLEKLTDLLKQAPEDYQRPLPEVGLMHKVLGNVPKHLVRLAWVCDQFKIQMDKESMEHDLVCTGNITECEKVWKSMTSLDDQIETVSRMLFTSIREEMGLDLYKYPDLEIVDGWRVAAVTKENHVRPRPDNGPMFIMDKEIRDA